AGLFSVAREYNTILYCNTIYTHAKLAKAFGNPMVLTTSGDVSQFCEPVRGEDKQWKSRVQEVRCQPTPRHVSECSLG
ncbi:hypothetical protein PG984_008973, partial [Apiospora sp. TS-2023a]